MAEIGSRHKAGDKPGRGLYRCLNCKEPREGIRLKSDDEPLPECPSCKHEADWEFVGKAEIVES